MDNDDLQAIVDDLAERLQRSVAIDDPSIRLLAASRHFGDEDALRVTSVLNRAVGSKFTDQVLAMGIATWTRPGSVEMDVEGCRRRLCAPIRCNGLLLGYLWLIDGEPPLEQTHVELAAETATRAGGVLYRRLLLHERLKVRHESILRELVSSDDVVRDHAVEDLRAEQLFPDEAMYFQVVTVQGDMAGATHEVALQAAVEEGLRAVLEAVSLVVANRSRAWILVAQQEIPSREMLDVVAARIAARFQPLTSGTGRMVVGVGPVVDRLDHVVESYRRALLAARAAWLVPGIGDLARWGEIGPYELLLQLPVDDIIAAAELPALTALQREDVHGFLLQTLGAFLDNAGDVRRTADLLCVHRATLYHRLKRIERITGCDLSNGDNRLTLHLGLKLRVLAAAHRTAPSP